MTTQNKLEKENKKEDVEDELLKELMEDKAWSADSRIAELLDTMEDFAKDPVGPKDSYDKSQTLH